MFIHRKKVYWHCKENWREVAPAVMKKVYKFHSEFFKNRNHTADLSVHASIIIKMVIKNRMKGWGQDSFVGFCKKLVLFNLS